MSKNFIVAEISKTWNETTPVEELISRQFEEVINVNYHRGYNLKEWNISSVLHDGFLTETIIAIFIIDRERILK
jgi:hypothetical protein